MNSQQIKELLDRLRKNNVKYCFNSHEGEDGTFWIGNLERIQMLDLLLLRTYEFDIKEYFKHNIRDIM